MENIHPWSGEERRGEIWWAIITLQLLIADSSINWVRPPYINIRHIFTLQPPQLKFNIAAATTTINNNKYVSIVTYLAATTTKLCNILEKLTKIQRLNRNT